MDFKFSLSENAAVRTQDSVPKVENWAGSVASSIYDTAVYLGGNHWVQAGVIAGAVALYAGRSKIGSLLDEILPIASGLIPDATSASTSRLFAPALIRAERAQSPALLLNESRVVSALAKLNGSAKWQSLDLARDVARENLAANQISEFRLPPGVAISAESAGLYGGNAGAKWFANRARAQGDSAFAESDSFAVSLREPLLNKTFVGLNKTIGLPWKGLKVEGPARLADAAYALGSGDMFVAPPFLKKEFPALVETLTHEDTHLEQDFLVTARLADRLSIGRQATPEQLDCLSDLYAHDLKMVPEIGHLERVLNIRDGSQLTAGASKRADALTDSLRTFRIENEQHYTTEQQVEAISAMRQSLASKSATTVLNDALIASAQDPLHRLVLKHPKMADLLQQLPARNDGLVPTMNLRDSHILDLKFFKILDERYQELELLRKANLKVYQSWLHESEAFAVGNYFENRMAEVLPTSSS